MTLTDVVAVLTAASTVAAAVAAAAAVRTSRSALAMQKLSVGLEGRRIAAADIARWALTAGEAIERVHDPRTWPLYAPAGTKPEDVLPPSHGLIGQVIAIQVEPFEAVRELAQLSFGTDHEVSRTVDEVIEAIREVAGRGLISGPDEDETMTPAEYVAKVFWPRVEHLHEALTAALDLSASDPRIRRA
ncbi:hypothetical protein [Conexibacter sp. CPCC 206217]|uniref:hypothetical protein n=1 Tax=Conexibacter sp. CPCC 206217 TaxID=3064574 RepID=UPI0027237467|nr:hypothetical protein [Conexibacter sp. CPCC 206217]MDO8208952.1 hypothetical protein [Conexibacter sp. CPCC 206217]